MIPGSWTSEHPSLSVGVMGNLTHFLVYAGSVEIGAEFA